MKRFFGILVALLMLCAGLGAESQDDLIHPAKIGITAATTGIRFYSGVSNLLPEDIWLGVVFHVVPALALRPSLVFYKTEREVTDNLAPADPTTSTSAGLGGALGVFYFTRPKRNFMLYTGPEVKFFFSSEIDFYEDDSKESDTSIKQLTAAGVIGAQYMLSDRFGFQADVGLGMLRYIRHTREWDAGGTKNVDGEGKDTTFFLRPAYLGAVFYFN